MTYLSIVRPQIVEKDSSIRLHIHKKEKLYFGSVIFISIYHGIFIYFIYILIYFYFEVVGFIEVIA